MIGRGAAVTLALFVGLVLWLPVHLVAQQFRISGVTTFQHLSVRPLQDDSIAIDDAVGSGLLRHTPDGYVVRCLSGEQFCRFRRNLGAESTVPLVQDLNINVWGLGRGIRGFVKARGRGMLIGDAAFWPRSEDHVDLVAAYVEVDRSTFRARVGRQWTTGLGYHNYDGVALRVRPLDALHVEAYGGRSLARGINEPLTSSELLEVESFAPDEGAYVVGARVGLRPNRRGGFSTQYQRELRTDRLGLYSERVAADAFVRFGATTVDGTLKIDWATGAVNDGRLRAWASPLSSLRLSAYLRHYEPFFDLWSIWGAFSPLSYNEAGVSASWHRQGSSLSLDGWISGRSYVGENADDLFGAVRSTGWRFGLSSTARVPDDWTLFGQYRAEVGLGAARSDVNASVHRQFGTNKFLAVNVGAFQELYEFRVDEGRIWLAGAEGGWGVGPRMRLVGGLMAYHHVSGPDGPEANWTQLRGSLRFEWTVGSEPGLRAFGGINP